MQSLKWELFLTQRGCSRRWILAYFDPLHTIVQVADVIDQNEHGEFVELQHQSICTFAHAADQVCNQINISIAKNLGLPVVIITKGESKSVQEVVDNALSTAKSFTDQGVQILTVVVNKMDSTMKEELHSKLSKSLPAGTIVTTLPSHKDLNPL